MKPLTVYIALFVALFFCLNINVIRHRRKNSISVGDGGNEDLIRARSVYSNFLEFSTVYFIVLVGAVSESVSVVFIFATMTLFFVARFIHIFAILSKRGIWRVVGIAGSHTAILSLCKCIILHSLQ